MKDLNHTKKYNLSQLNDEQLHTVLDWLKVNDEGWGYFNIADLRRISGDYNLHYNKGLWYWINKKDCDKVTNALELFEEKLSNIKLDLKTPSVLTNEQINIMLDSLRNEPYCSCDKSDVYSDIKNLIEKGKQHGLKIVVTFEKL